MASNLQTVLSEDLETALAPFVTPGPINSKPTLDAAILDLLGVLQLANTDVSSLLTAITNQVDGLLEVVIASRDEAAFTFRSRVLKALQKSVQYPDPIFITCTERIGGFLVSIPPRITLDQNIMTKHREFTATVASIDNTEPEYLLHKEEELPEDDLIEPSKTTRSGKRHQRVSSVRPTVQDTGRHPAKSMRASTGVLKEPPSPTVATNRSGPTPTLSEQLKGCLECYFVAGHEEGVEEFAVDKLFRLLVPLATALSGQEAPDETIPESSQYTVEEPSQPFSRATISLTDVFRDLGDTIKPKLGPWLVVVSQRGIKHVRKYCSHDRETFARIEETMRQLALGSFSTSNHVKLIEQNHGVPIYAADLGSDLRLLYHIDFGAPTHSTMESQFIRIFGPFPNAEIDVEFWKAISAQLGRRGSEYILNCTVRIETEACKPSKSSVTTVPPKVFRPLNVSQCSEQKLDAEIDESKRLELHRVLSLGKFVPLSDTFFDAIQMFDETNFMFSLSAPENRIITHPSSCLVLGRSGTGKTTCMLFRIIGLDIAAKNQGQTLRQVFVTRSRTLARKVRLDFLQFMQTENGSSEIPVQVPSLGLSLLDMDENAEEEGLLPSKFSELHDSHFPLFVTYDQLCKLLEADFNLRFEPSSLPLPKKVRARVKQSATSQSSRFASKDSALVYTEFMGIIKGSETSLYKHRRYLDKTEYEEQNNRSVLGESVDKAKIYSMFQSYQKLRPAASYDVADRAHVLMAALQERGVPGKGVDFLYVDEAQDNLIIDAAMLRVLCSNPHGLFFAGDTAQTISVGSAFRFSELKAFLYRLERNDTHLSTNYRSHGGIVKAAAFIVKLLDSYFQRSIDSLTPEAAHVDVDIHKPTFFCGMSSPADFRTFITEPSSGMIGLGARQVIIVRNEPAASSLRAIIGRVAVILNLYESKGMEFNDVILYNFFTDSPATVTDWRAMSLSQDDKDRFFDERRHSILRSELKSLYVGLTRARERVWIWEESGDGRVMEALLVASSLATSSRGEFVPRIAVRNHKGEWAEQAQQYFAKNLFSEAAFCFSRADLPWWMAVAQTYKDRQEAMRLDEKDPLRLPKFSELAQTFDRLAQEGQRKENQESLRLLFANAGECYTVASKRIPAAAAFLKARKYTAAAYQYRMGGCFDEAVDVVKRHCVDPDVAEGIKYAAKFVFTRKGDVRSLHKAWKLCESKEDFLEFLIDHGFEDQRISFLDSITEHERVGQVLWEAGDHVNAVLRYNQSDDPSSPHQASRCILEGIRSNVPLATSYGNESTILSELFKLSRTAALTPEEKAEVRFLRAVANLDTAELKRYGQQYLDKQDLTSALLALDALTQSAMLDGLRSTKHDEIAETLLLCQKFGVVINTIVRTTDFVDLPGIQHILGVSNTSSKSPARQPSQSKDVTLQKIVQPCSFIHSLAYVLVNREGQPRSLAEPITLPTSTVDDMVRRALLRRLNAVVERVDELARKSGAFELCQQFLVNQQCGGRDEGSCWKDHILEKDLTIEQFNSRFRLHILVIAVLNHFTALFGAFDERTRSIKQKTWITKLFQLCYPTSNKAGCLSDITPALIPEYSLAMPVVQCWLHEVFRNLRPADQVKYFLTNILITCLLATAFDYKEAVTYLWRGQWSLDPPNAFQNGLIQENNKPAVGSAIIWLAKRTTTRINLGIYFLSHVLDHEVHLDAEVAVAFAEEVSAQLILNHYAHSSTGYDYMVMPRSWIVRAFGRAEAPQVNGSMPWKLATVLDTFLSTLLLRRRAGVLVSTFAVGCL
ncbi:hypothetical protein FRC00_000874 [Tulasnella sp. 408]|nr:hypothetical protein FRC00_000874 [Tulasnella sp. 408]